MLCVQHGAVTDESAVCFSSAKSVHWFSHNFMKKQFYSREREEPSTYQRFLLAFISWNVIYNSFICLSSPKHSIEIIALANTFMVTSKIKILHSL